MPYGFSSYRSDAGPQVPVIGRPKRDRSKTKASRRANRARRR